MAKQTGVITYTGKLGNTVGFEREGEYLIRMMPDEVKRTWASKRAAFDFGTASKAGKLIRHALLQSGELPHDWKVTNRLSTVLGKVIRKDKERLPGNRRVLQQNLHRLKGFRFNEHAGTRDILQADVKVEEGRVSIPSITGAKKTRGTTHIEIKIITLSANFAKETVTQTKSAPLLIHVRNPSEPVEIMIPEAVAEAVVVILQVREFQEINGYFHLVENKAHAAADIIAVIPPKEPEVITVYNKPSDIKHTRSRKRLRIRNFPPPG